MPFATAEMIPAELYHLIARQLHVRVPEDHAALKCASLVCREWHYASHAVLMEHILVRPRPDVTNKAGSQSFILLGHERGRPVLDPVELIPELSTPDSCLLRSLRHLTIASKYNHDGPLDAMPEHKGWSETHIIDVLGQDVSLFHNLRSLKLGWTSFTEVDYFAAAHPAWFQTLSKVSLHYVSFGSLSQLVELIRYFPCTRELELRDIFFTLVAEPHSALQPPEYSKPCRLVFAQSSRESQLPRWIASHHRAFSEIFYESTTRLLSPAIISGTTSLAGRPWITGLRLVFDNASTRPSVGPLQELCETIEANLRLTSLILVFGTFVGQFAQEFQDALAFLRCMFRTDSRLRTIPRIAISWIFMFWSAVDMILDWNAISDALQNLPPQAEVNFQLAFDTQNDVISLAMPDIFAEFKKLPRLTRLAFLA